MKFSLGLDQTAGPQVDLERSVWSGSTKLLVDGQLIQSTSKRPLTYQVKTKDGRDLTLVVKYMFFDPAPQIFLDGKELIVARKLSKLEYAVSYLPITLLFLGGALGGILGALATYLNLFIMRSTMPPALKWIVPIAVTIATYVVFFVVVAILELLLKH